MSDDERASWERGPVRIGVGYGWEHGKHPLSDTRWKVVGAFVRAAAEDGWNRACTADLRSVVIEDDEPTEAEDAAEMIEASPRDVRGPDADRVRGVRVARLRATAGDFTWSSVMQHIDDCDVLVFDMTPTKRVEGTDVLGTTPNVWLELGYALHTGKPVYVVHESEKGHHDLPSDLKGLVVGRIANEEGKTDTSLRMSLVSTVRKLLLASLKSSFHTNKEVQS